MDATARITTESLSEMKPPAFPVPTDEDLRHHLAFVGGAVTLPLSGETVPIETALAALRQPPMNVIGHWLDNELADFAMVIRHCSTVYSEVSGGRISKPTTLPEEVLAVANDLETERVEEAIAEALAAERADHEETKKLLEALLADDGPDGRRVTNAQHVALREDSCPAATRKAAEEALAEAVRLLEYIVSGPKASIGSIDNTYKPQLDRHRLDAMLAQMRAARALLAAQPESGDARLDAAILWALGIEGEFPPREPVQPPYYWRRELAERAGIDMGQPSRPAPSPAHAGCGLCGGLPHSEDERCPVVAKVSGPLTAPSPARDGFDPICPRCRRPLSDHYPDHNNDPVCGDSPADAPPARDEVREAAERVAREWDTTRSTFTIQIPTSLGLALDALLAALSRDAKRGGAGDRDEEGER